MTIVTSRDRVAYHEAGHALVALREGRSVTALSIDGALLGGRNICAYSGGDDSPESGRAELRIALAGAVAETMARPTRTSSALTTEQEIYPTPDEIALLGALERYDAERETETDDDAAARMVSELEPGDPAAELELARELVWRALAVDSDLLHRLAAHLVAWRTLTPGDIEEIIGGNPE